MTLLAATATTPPLPIPPLSVILAWLILAALVWVLGYAAACAATPFGRCRRCEGHGKTITPNGRVRRWCRHCDATGLRLRWGRRLFNYLRRLYRDGSR
ncbi:hypothetical protein [Microbispora amethystogenes]|uniref:hypothetical protein n=1 Tax=Microbispora amethystogenes TaxID=1427754 RepID=UPI001953BA7A|nr:hypothetical protein [Microbispora amethystogenes]